MIDYFALGCGFFASFINLMILAASFYPLIVKQEHITLAIAGFVASIGFLGFVGYFGAQLEGSGPLFFALGFGLMILLAGAFYPLLSRIIGPVDQRSKSFHDTQTA